MLIYDINAFEATYECYKAMRLTTNDTEQEGGDKELPFEAVDCAIIVIHPPTCRRTKPTHVNANINHITSSTHCHPAPHLSPLPVQTRSQTKHRIKGTNNTPIVVCAAVWRACG